MLRYLPIALGFVAIIVCWAWQAQIVDRYGDSTVTAAELAKRFSDVPTTIGEWTSQQIGVTEEIRKRAGAVGHINRKYVNSTGDEVVLWLIVGHPRDVVRHTPQICYPAQGFRQLADEIPFTIPVAGDQQTEFWTAAFRHEGDGLPRRERVFWAWSTDGNWMAPRHPRFEFGNTKGLFKMYFTCVERDSEQTAAKSPAVEFAEEFIPLVNSVLFTDESPVAQDEQTSGSSTES